MPKVSVTELAHRAASPESHDLLKEVSAQAMAGIIAHLMSEFAKRYPDYHLGKMIAARL